MNKDKTFEIRIDSLAVGGDGIGRVNGKAVFVAGAFPGDTVLARTRLEKKRFIKAEVSTLINRSDIRREPLCPHASECAGCPWIFIDYNAQLEWKQRLVSDTLSRIGKIDAKVSTVVPSEQTEGYRSRVRLKVEPDGSAIGYVGKRSSTIVPIESCRVASVRVNRIMAELREFFSNAPDRAKAVGEIIIETGSDDNDGRIVFRLKKSWPKETLALCMEKMDSAVGVVSIIEDRIKSVGQTNITMETAEGVKITSGPETFTQANLSLNKVLTGMVVSRAELSEGDTCLDLFCGIGNYTFALSRTGVVVTGVDSSFRNIEDAKRNMAGHTNVNFIQDDFVDAAFGLEDAGRTFDCLVVNPPRKGLEKFAGKIAPLAKRRIVYVSCDPATFARDAQIICSAGFDLDSVEPIDMFPQTPHIELVATFTKR